MTHTRATLSANTTNTLSEADRQKEISQIKRENSNIFKNLSVLESEFKAVVREYGIVIRNKTEQIKHLAENYERLHELGDYKEPISHICATISRQLESSGNTASASLARRELDAKYKQVEFTAEHNAKTLQSQSTEVETDNGFVDIINKPEDNQFHQADYSLAEAMNQSLQHFGQSAFVDPTDSHIIVQIDKPPAEMKNDELRKVSELLVAKERKSREALLEDRRRKREFLEECEKRKVALSPEYEQLPIDHISAKSPDSGPSRAWEACCRLHEKYGKLCDKLHRWRPPEDIQDAMVEAFESDIEFLEPFIDEKHRLSQPGWWMTQLDNKSFGKHAAGVMAGTPLTDKQIRKVTREQVGDREKQDLARAILFVGAIKKWAALWKWFDRMNRVGIAQRAADLSGTLSDKAFS